MLHNEARELLVKAYAKHPVAKDIAEAFSISTSEVYRLVRQKARTGSVELRVSQRGRKKLLSEEDIQNIKAQIEAHNDITIEEIREALNLKASYTTVERAVNGLGYSRYPLYSQSACILTISPFPGKLSIHGCLCRHIHSGKTTPEQSQVFFPLYL